MYKQASQMLSKLYIKYNSSLRCHSKTNKNPDNSIQIFSSLKASERVKGVPKVMDQTNQDPEWKIQISHYLSGLISSQSYLPNVKALIINPHKDSSYGFPFLW